MAYIIHFRVLITVSATLSHAYYVRTNIHYSYCNDGLRLWLCGTETHNGPTFHLPDNMSEYWAVVEWYWQGKTEVLRENLSQCHFVNNKSHTECPGDEPGSLQWEADVCLCYGMALRSHTLEHVQTHPPMHTHTTYCHMLGFHSNVTVLLRKQWVCCISIITQQFKQKHYYGYGGLVYKGEISR
jgi:hypothetical protein